MVTLLSSLTAYCYLLFWSGIGNELWIWVYVDELAIVFILLTRLPQIYKTYKTGSLAGLSKCTAFLAWMGSAIRLLTVLLESDNLMFDL